MHYIAQGHPTPFMHYPHNNNYPQTDYAQNNGRFEAKQFVPPPHYTAPYERYPPPAAYASSHVYERQSPPQVYPPSPPSSPSKNEKTSGVDGIKKKKRKTKKNKIIIPMKDMIRLFSMPQPVAARKLNVSISTLKRRFYELDITRWPSNHTLQEFNLGEMNSIAMKSSYHRTGSNADLIHSSQALKQNASYYSMYKEATQTEKQEMGALLNLYDTADEKHIDPMTAVILKEAFLENTDFASDDDSSSSKKTKKLNKQL